MSLKNKFIPAIALAVAVGAFSTYSSAQTTTAPAQQDGIQKHEKREKRGFGRRGEFDKGARGDRGGKFGMHGLRGVNLTDAQKEQLRTIMEANRSANQASFEEFRSLREARRNGTLTAEQQNRLQTLREQMKQNAEQTRTQVLAILTPEQRTQLEQQKQEREKRREERRQMRKNRQAPSTSQES
jgi:Spy/CpxP family protein refolding chaperone